jgi:hypothetical protein
MTRFGLQVMSTKIVKRARQTCLIALGGLLANVVVGAAAEITPIPADPTKQLVLDQRVVARTQGLRLVMGQVQKEHRNPLFRADRPWENALNNLYPNLLWDQDEQIFKLWYKCVLAEPEAISKLTPPATVHDVGWFLLYATSADGLTWQKPDLGLIGFDGSMRNNIVARDTPNVGVFKDLHDADPGRRYKMIYDVGLGKMRVRFSFDGLRWSEPAEPRGFTAFTGDTHNNAFWDARQQSYICLTRFYLSERLVARSQSRDFLKQRRRPSRGRFLRGERRTRRRSAPRSIAMQKVGRGTADWSIEPTAESRAGIFGSSAPAAMLSRRPTRKPAAGSWSGIGRSGLAVRERRSCSSCAAIRRRCECPSNCLPATWLSGVTIWRPPLERIGTSIGRRCVTIGRKPRLGRPGGGR